MAELFIHDDTLDLEPCPMCWGVNTGPIGQLGNRIHYQCRDCGAQFSKPADGSFDGSLDDGE